MKTAAGNKKAGATLLLLSYVILTNIQQNVNSKPNFVSERQSSNSNRNDPFYQAPYEDSFQKFFQTALLKPCL